MLTTRYSLRWLLAVTVAAAGVFFLLSLAVRSDRTWLAAILGFIGALAAILAVHALLFVCVWAYTEIAARRDPSRDAERGTS